jgi:hypothetical protein
MPLFSTRPLSPPAFRFKQWVAVCIASLIAVASSHVPLALAFTPARDLNTPEAVKSELLAVAQSHKGEGDPKLEIQQQLEPYVQRLIELAPQPPITERKELLVGGWQQVWGPYDYRDTEKRGVDPGVDANNIYQVVFPGGYYYNVANELDRKTVVPRQTTLLRGEYSLQDNNQVDVQFTHLRKLETIPAKNIVYTDLPALSEVGNLPSEKTVLWSWLVRLLIGNGTLQEVYTDEDLRLTYGSNGDKTPYLYVLKRVEANTR